MLTPQDESQHYGSPVQHQNSGYQNPAAGAYPQTPDYSNYGPMYSSYMKCRSNPYARPGSAGGTTASTASNSQSAVSTSIPPSPQTAAAGIYYPAFAAAAAGLYPHGYAPNYGTGGTATMHGQHMPR